MSANKHGKDIARHILPTSSNLLALCFILLGFIRLSRRLSNAGEKSIVDGCLAVVIAIFLFSSIFSYASMRSDKRSERTLWENCRYCFYYWAHLLDSSLNGNCLSNYIKSFGHERRRIINNYGDAAWILTIHDRGYHRHSIAVVQFLTLRSKN